jgi:hypothetical protein
MKYGNWTTIRCPNNIIDEAYEYLKQEVEDISGIVRKEFNDFFLGQTYSIEIDYPVELENVTDDEDAPVTLLRAERIIWQNKICEIIRDFNKKFQTYL